MEVEQARVIFSAMTEINKKGIGIISLSVKTGISQSTLRQYLTEHKDYFVKVGNNSTYTINRFSEYRGSVEAMLIDLEKQNKNKISSTSYSPIMVFLFIMVFYFISNNT
jgi:hypothetical protein